MDSNPHTNQKHKLKIVSKLGQGAFGTVYKGTYDGRPCAVKTVSDEHDKQNSVAVRMFLREAQVLQACDHRAIIKYKALCRVNTGNQAVQGDAPGGRYALVVEYAKDGTLCQKVSRQMINPSSKVYSNAQALSWAADIASALEYLHMRSPAVFHRDVKLSNIVVTRDDNGDSRAKLSDFGLHVVADCTKDRLIRVSCHLPNPPCASPALCFSTAAAAAGGAQHMSFDNILTEQHVRELQQQLDGSDAKAAVSGPTNVFDRDSAWQQQGKLSKVAEIDATTAAAAGDDHDYSEVHESCGRRTSYIGGHMDRASSGSGNLDRSCGSSNARYGPTVVAAALQQQRLHAAVQSSSTEQQQGEDGPQHRRSFVVRRSPHHPGDLSAVRVPSCSVAAPGDNSAPAAFGNSSSYYYDDWDDAGSMCSMITDGTWASTATGGTADGLPWTEDGSMTGSMSGSCEEQPAVDMETVFNMTGQTGSAMYMAPEVFLGEPYNEKADVFSFGVVLYELMSRCLLIFTELPTSTTDPSAPDRYAAKVAEGYRPARPRKMPAEVWQLISACWQQDPVMRPHMTEVVEVLEDLLQQEQQAKPSSRRRPGAQVTHPPAAKALPAHKADHNGEGPSVGPHAAAASGAAPVKAGCCVIS